VPDADIETAVQVLRSDFLTQGPTVARFEAAVAQCVGSRYAVAVNSATSALHIACETLGLGPGDWLWTVPNTFVASANCGLYCGAQVDFVDIDSRTWNMSTERLKDKLVAAMNLANCRR
jgi:dTDP-4-amino-4,6-dideoxygalactose transaminase